MHVYHTFFIIICWWTLRLIPHVSNCEHWGANIFSNQCLLKFLFIYLGCLGSYLWHIESNSLTRYWMQFPYIRNSESESLDHQRSHQIRVFFISDIHRSRTAESYGSSRASLVAQLVKNPPAMQETLVRFLGQEDPLEKGMATHSSILSLLWWLSW